MADKNPCQDKSADKYGYIPSVPFAARTDSADRLLSALQFHISSFQSARAPAFLQKNGLHREVSYGSSHPHQPHTDHKKRFPHCHPESGSCRIRPPFQLPLHLLPAPVPFHGAPVPKSPLRPLLLPDPMPQALILPLHFLQKAAPVPLHTALFRKAAPTPR